MTTRNTVSTKKMSPRNDKARAHQGTGTQRNGAKVSDAMGEDDADRNLVVLLGQVQRDATVTETPDGATYTGFDLVCRTPAGRTVVPVTVEGESVVAAGLRVAVIGHVNKRFFSAGSGLSSRTDVRADKVTVIRRRDQVSRVISAAVQILGGD